MTSVGRQAPAQPAGSDLYGTTATCPGDNRARTPRQVIFAGARDLLELMRPVQWTKNFFTIPLALLDARWTTTSLASLGLTLALFILISSFVYIVNDIADRKLDRMHPVKRRRPIADGRIPVPVAMVAAFLIGSAALMLGLLLPAGCAVAAALYALLNLAYNIRLKAIALVDVFVISAGFALRLLAGYASVGAVPQSWLIVSVFSVCLALVTGKRHHELETSGTAHRPALSGYSVRLAEQLILATVVITVLAFLLYLSNEALLGAYRPFALLCSLPLLLFGIFRYLQLVSTHRVGDDLVRTLLGDRPIVITALSWCAVLAFSQLAARGLLPAPMMPALRSALHGLR